jgi:hypothetical protein
MFIFKSHFPSGKGAGFPSIFSLSYGFPFFECMSPARKAANAVVLSSFLGGQARRCGLVRPGSVRLKLLTAGHQGRILNPNSVFRREASFVYCEYALKMSRRKVTLSLKNVSERT